MSWSYRLPWLILLGWLVGAATVPGHAQNPCPPDTEGPFPGSIQAGIPDDFAQPSEETYLGPGFDVIPVTWVSFDYPGRDRNFGHTIRYLPAHVLSARLLLRIKSMSSLSSNDSIGLEFTGGVPAMAWSGRIAKLLGTPWNQVGEKATLILNLDALPLADGTTVSILDYLNRDHALDIYMQDDTSVDFIDLEMEACSRDCNQNGTPDYLDLTIPGASDCNNNGILDSCEPADDCNGNGLPDVCEMAAGEVTDCNRNGIPDSCELSYGTLTDCNCNGIADVCESVSVPGEPLRNICGDGPSGEDDCNGNGIFDRCELASLADVDCNDNGVLDSCEPGGGLIVICEDTATAVVGDNCTVRVPLQPLARGGCGKSSIDFTIEPPVVGPDGVFTLDAFPPGVFTVTFTATDTAGNTASCNTLVVVEDDRPPVIKAKEKRP